MDALKKSLFAIIAFILTTITILLAIRWRRREKIIMLKFSKTTKKYESFQDVILRNFDTTRTNNIFEITCMSDSMLDRLGYTGNEVLGL